MMFDNMLVFPTDEWVRISAMYFDLYEDYQFVEF